MKTFAGIAGAGLMFLVLLDAFETIILPRRVTRRFRLTRFFYLATWKPWSAISRRFKHTKRRESYLGFFGPLSLILLLTMWALGLVFSFALLHWSAGSDLRFSDGQPGFLMDLYLSGTTFFTLGLGDVVPHTGIARVLTVSEGGLGFGFLAIVIGYLPVIYQAFSRREVSISLLDARAGSPPTAGELLRRHGYDHGMESLRELLHDWEHWSADLLESHLSYPVLAYFRSQHNNQSWLTALTAILDVSALVMAGVDGACERQAELTFAMARHAVVDLAQVFGTPPAQPVADRLPPELLRQLRRYAAESGVRLRDGYSADQRLAELRGLYEPYIYSLARYLEVSLPAWMPASAHADNWQTSAWEKKAALRTAAAEVPAAEDHF